MATIVWQGGAPAVAQVQTWAFSGTWEASDIITVSIGDIDVAITAGSTVTNTVVTTVVAALEALSSEEYPQFQEITWTASPAGTVRGTADTAGKPFTATFSTADSGGAADDQRIEGGTTPTTGTAATACTGPNHADEAMNFVGGVLPADGDALVFANSSIDVLYGLDNNAITPASIEFDMSYSGNVGLPLYDEVGGYYQYRETHLKYGNSGDAGNIAVTIGNGEGGGSRRIKLGFGTGQVTCIVNDSGEPEVEGGPAVFLKGTHTSNVFTIRKGKVGIAYYPGEASAIATLNIGYEDSVDGDAVVQLGSGITQLTTLSKSGGLLISESLVGTGTQVDGTWIQNAGAITAAVIDGGTFVQNSTGTLATLTASGNARLDFSQDMRAKTITNPVEIYGNAKVIDPFKLIASLVVDLNRTGSDLSGWNLGTHWRLTRGSVA